MSAIPVIDLFAGPGGLGEGFASVRTRGSPVFDLVLSIEKDSTAHATLRLRALRRKLGSGASQAYKGFLRGGSDWSDLCREHPRESAAAASEARQLELGPQTLGEVRSLVRHAVGGVDRWVLIGGPPCQAYSLVGRARNRGVNGYAPDLDKRQTLYVEYLQILADHAPPVFVMENVKGLLSARLNDLRLFDRIRDDLSNPARALIREGRSRPARAPSYEIRPLSPSSPLTSDDPSRFVVRAEQFGIPQRRHRVILLGVRSDLASQPSRTLHSSHRIASVAEALRGLPPVRSGLSRVLDSNAAWLNHLASVPHRRWLTGVESDVRAYVRDIVQAVRIPRASRGNDFLVAGARHYLNHSTRGHIGADLDRYLFSAAFAHVRQFSPVLSDFPQALLPAHANVDKAITNAMFADRFRVQLAGEPATTITAHISKDGHYYIHPDPTQCRSLTVREAARLQTFPDDYFFCGPRTAQFQQVGNAVPPELATRIARVVAELLA